MLNGVPLPAGASPEDCHAIGDDDLRLSCYDTETEYAAVDNSDDATDLQNVPSTLGNWRVSEDTSEMTDFDNIFASLQSENEVRHDFHHQRRTGKATLTIRCVDNRTDMYIVMDGKFLADSGSFGSVDIRIDDNASRSFPLSESTDNEALGLWNGRPIPLLKRMIGAESVRFEVTPFNEGAQVMRFDVEGIDNIIEQVRMRCGW
jgi:type VI secretion system VasI family protein